MFTTFYGEPISCYIIILDYIVFFKIRFNPKKRIKNKILLKFELHLL